MAPMPPCGGSHYGSVDFEIIGRGRASGRFEGDILPIERVAAPGAEALASKVLAMSIHH
jgi:hypothetical protein